MGGCIGQIIESKSSNFKVGDHVKANFGWREYWLSNDINRKKMLFQKSIPQLLHHKIF
ncbi:MAG: hypothetical protein AB7U98_04785 [Candidatus Nitrosocosmicus sp.]|nr:hypothetical protein [Candidatus Nitrosocosmicus sp.]